MNFPINNYSIPYADPPYPIIIIGEYFKIETDNCGTTFKLTGDKYKASVAIIDLALKETKGTLNKDYSKNIGPIKFVFLDQKLTDAEYHNKDVAINFYNGLNPEVIEFIEIIKLTLKLKAFL